MLKLQRLQHKAVLNDDYDAGQIFHIISSCLNYDEIMQTIARVPKSMVLPQAVFNMVENHHFHFYCLIITLFLWTPWQLMCCVNTPTRVNKKFHFWVNCLFKVTQSLDSLLAQIKNEINSLQWIICPESLVLFAATTLHVCMFAAERFGQKLEDLCRERATLKASLPSRHPDVSEYLQSLRTAVQSALQRNTSQYRSISSLYLMNWIPAFSLSGESDTF